MMKRWFLAAVLVLLAGFTAGQAFGGWLCFNDCARTNGDGTAANVTSWTVYDASDPALSDGYLKDVSTGLDVPARVAFSMGPEGLAVSRTSGANPDAGTEAHNLFAGVVDFSGPIIYYGDYGWHVDVTISGLNPAKTYTFAGTAIRGQAYPDRQSHFTIIGTAHAVNNSSAGVVFKDATNTVLLAGDNSTAGCVVRWDDIRVADDGSGTGSFTIRAQASAYTNNLDVANSDRGRAYPLNGFLLEEHDMPPANCPVGDLDGDCIVSVTDVVQFAAAWLQTGPLPANLDGQGAVDVRDFSLLAADWLVNAQTGSLTVILDGPAPAGAQWQVDGGPWHNSGETATGLSTGSHTVGFSDAAGWNTPGEQSVDIHYNQTTTLHAAYIEQTGSVQVIILDPVPAGARWQVAGGAWHAGGESFDGLNVGSHVITFSEVADWDRPGDETVEIVDGETTLVTVAYARQTGALTVMLSPAAAVDAGAQWRVDGGEWQAGGATVTGLITGEHTITYSAVAGWNRPANSAVTIRAGETATTTGIYTLQTGTLTVTIAPAEAVAAGAQWRVNGGAWQASGATVSGLLIGGHTVEYKDVPGWARPGSETVTIFNAQTTTLAGTYTQQTGSVSVTITEPKPAGAQWRADGGGWQASGAVVGGLAVGPHLIEYAQVGGWDAPAAETVSVTADQTTFVTAAYAEQTGSVTATITPAAAITAGAQWQIDGGAWRDSGATESNLSVGDHVVRYKAIADWDAPAEETVTVYKNQTTAASANYVQHTGSLTVTIAAPVPTGAQWRVGAGPWQASGATVGDLPVGEHLVEFTAVAGYDAPPAETMSIFKDQLATTTAAYVRQTGTLTVTIQPAEAVAAGGRWRVDGGDWQISGATVTDLHTGTHTVAYLGVTGWTTPVDETVTVDKDQMTAVTGTYIQQTGSLMVTISAPVPAGAQWRVDGGSWQVSGATVGGLPVGQHTVSYSAVADHDAPADETVMILEDQTAAITATYTPHTGALTVTLTPAEAIAAGAQWRVDGGAWRDSGFTAAGLPVGSHTVSYRSIAGWDTPAGEMVTIVKDQTATAAAMYVRQTGSLTVTITPAEAVSAGAQWRIDGGGWNNSGATLDGLAVGTHTLTFSDVAGWARPGSTTVEILSGQTITASGVYTQQTGSLRVTISPQAAVSAGAQWRVDGGAWQDSGAMISGLAVGLHTVAYSAVAGWTGPADETVDIAADLTASVAGTYTEQIGAIQVLFDPGAVGAQWRVDGGVWNDGGAIVSGLPVGPHAVAYSIVADYDKPADEMVEVFDGQTTMITRGYVRHTGSLIVTISPAEAAGGGAQWRVDGGAWKNSGATVTGLVVGDHTVEFGAIGGWDAPANKTVTIAKDQTASAGGTYVRHTGSLTVTLSPAEAAAAGAQWRVDGGAWNSSGQTESGLAVGDHAVDFRTIVNWDAPATRIVTIAKDQTAAISGVYVQHTGSLTVTISPADAVAEGARWRVNGGVWNISGATVDGLAVGDHVIEFNTIAGWDTPADKMVAISNEQAAAAAGVYVLQTGSLSVTLASPVPAGARWRVDGGAWQDSGQMVGGLRTGEHLLSFSDVADWEKPADETVAIVKDQTTTLVRAYSEHVGSLTVTIMPAEAAAAGAQWRVDGGAWRSSGYTQTGLAVGPHTVEYSAVSGWNTPTDEAVDIFHDQLTSTGGTYVRQTGALQVTIADPKPAGAQWRVDGGAWNNSGATVSGIATGMHTVSYSAVAGWDAPADELVAILDSQTITLTAAYSEQTGSLTVTISPAEAVAAGAMWQVDGGIWRNSGDTVSSLAVGSHTVAYSTVAGWEAPADQAVIISQHETTSTSGTYTSTVGGLSVIIEPAEVRSAGARWRVDGGAWQVSGATVTALAAGGHTVEYNTISGWISPVGEMAFVTGGQTTTITRNYTQSLGEVTVTIYPQAAIAAGAMWRVDNGAWQVSDATVSSLSAGWHTVEYLAIAAWTTPADETILISGGQTAASSGVYVQQSWPQLHISEFMADNANTLDDADGNSSDWIEIYNPTALPVDLDGWYLTDDAADKTRWRIPAVTVEAGGFLVVFASGKDRTGVGIELHTNFSLSRDGEYLALIAPDGVSVVSSYDPHYPQQLVDISYGTAQYATELIPAGAWVKYIVPTADDAEADWTVAEYNDTSWGTGLTALGFSAGASVGMGVDYEYYEGDWDSLPDFDSLTPVKEGKATNFDISPAEVPDFFGFRFRSRIRITEASNYTFYTESDDGSRLYIGDTLVVDNDGLHGMREAAGSITLAAGTWPITVTFFEKGGDAGLIVRYSSGSLPKQDIPDSALIGDVATDLSAPMLGVNASVWCRLAFEVEDPAAIDALTLQMRYEDGFVAYLNGQEVGRRNADGAITKASWNGEASTDRPDSEALNFENIGLTSYVGLLNARPAKNILAIHGLNDDVNDGEFMALPVLIGASNVETPQYFTTPTPGAYNVAGAMGVVDNVSYDIDRGFYTTPFDLTLTMDTPGAMVYYTLDGSTPSATNGTLYTAPIHISGTSTVRSVAVKAGYLDSKVKTHTYLFINDVLSQSPSGEAPGPGWPTGSVNGQVLDYGMDPDIVVSDPRYNTLVDDALLALPSISLVTDLSNLFDPAKGIYVNAGMDGAAWERPVSMELMYPDGTDGFHINAGLRIRGGYSRQGGNPKHAFRLFFRAEYGESKLNYSLFGDEGTDSFDKVDLRTAQNYSWSLEGSSNNTLCREVFSRDTQRDMDQPYTRSRYYHLYINGHYWGIFQTQERSEARFAESYFGGQVEDYDVVKVNTTAGYVIETTDGNLDAWRRIWEAAVAGLESAEAYYRVQGMNVDGTDNPMYERLVDIDNLIDYMVITYFVGDFDGPISNFLGNQSPNNYYGIYNRNARNGFKFFRHDAEHSLFAGWDRTGPWPAGQTFNKFNPQWLHQRLASNPEYRLHFADRVHKYFFNDGLLTPAANIARLMPRRDTIDLAIIAESARWGDSKTGTPLNRNDHWLPAVEWLVNAYFPVRTNEVLDQFRSHEWYPNVHAPVYNQNGGQVASGFNVTMTNPGGAGTIYYTTDGSDPRLPIRLSTPGGQVTLIAENAPKRVLVPTGDLQGGTGSILAEYWFGIEGTAVSALTSHPDYPDSPDSVDYRTQFEIPVDWSDFYGTRMRGYLYPPADGDYTFWIASDDASELWLSASADPAGMTRIAQVAGWTNSRQWDKEGGQKSTSISLDAGQKYYIEALQKEGSGGDNLAVAWQGPGFIRRVIDGQYLSPAGMVWVKNDYDDSTWTQGTGGVGYERRPGDAINYTSLIGIDVQSTMYTRNTTCYIRIPFTVGNTDLSALTLRVKYDDAFVAYLNGSEIARRNFDGAPQWNSYASASRSDSEAIIFEDIDLSAHIGKLRTGSNLLAMHGMNVTANNNDFLISVELVGHEINPGDVSPNAASYAGPITLTESTRLKARVLNGQWSALNDFTFAAGPVADNLRITEIMYHPADPNEEYVELTNIGPEAVNLNWAQFTKGIRLTFPSIWLSSGDYVVVVRNRAAFEARYGVGVTVAGEFDGALDNSGERISLVDAVGAIIHDFTFKDGWYEITDGAGFSLTIRDATAPISTWGDKSAWRPSAAVSGSPGYDDSGMIPAPGAVVINEVLAHSHGAAPDWIELHNTTAAAINIGGWFLSDDNEDLTKYEIAAGVSIPPHGYVVFYEDQHFNNTGDPGCRMPFALSENGEAVYLTSGEEGAITGYTDEEDFGASETGIAFGRYEKSTGTFNFVAMSTNTPGYANAYPQVGPLVISEIMYHPADNADAEYVELLNISDADVTLYDYASGEPWIFADDGGFTFVFPTAPVTLGAGRRLLLVKDPAAFSAAFTPAPETQIFAWNAGSLSNGGERIQLSKPGDVDGSGTRFYIRVDRVVYSDGSHPVGDDPWPAGADGGGHALHRVTPADYGNDVINWQAAPPTPGW